ncbi:MAG: peptide ABC transporter substrate-binding protein [Pyrinomonadaceae bacterium]
MPLTTISSKYKTLRAWVAITLLLALMLTHAGCFLAENVEPYYGRVVVPRSQELHWSDGGLPQTFDPAFAAAPPDTDLVRALFEGLTDYDPKTLQPVPAVATRWEPSNGGRTWTFYLRDDARWSNGESVTARDFVQSWKRTRSIGDLAPHTELLANIEGSRREGSTRRSTSPQSPSQPSAGKNTLKESAGRFGAEALSDSILRVRLRRPDMNFPALVAHPVFRPVKLEQEDAVGMLAPAGLVSNGAFSLAKAEGERVQLKRADNYWDKDKVALDRVEFVGSKDVESALAAYRAGEVDAVTNAAFEPLAIKLLTPYEDFRRTTYGALTYYSFNTTREPFDDVRVREALTLAIDRERISQDELGGATEPAKRFLPEIKPNTQEPVVDKSDLLEKDYERAKDLMAEANFPNGEGFPKIKLLINRNEQQRIVAQAIAAMWRSILNIETEIVIAKNWDEYEAVIRSGEYDIARRGIVMQTTDELTNIRMLFQSPVRPSTTAKTADTDPTGHLSPIPSEKASGGTTPERRFREAIETESQALKDLSAMPIYFASSYSLVKPYVEGFDSNVLDAPSLKTVRIKVGWQPPASSSATVK